MCCDKVNVFTQKLQEIGVTISSKMYKSLNPHNFLIIYCNIVMLQLKMIVSIQGVQLKKNFCSSTQSVLTTTQNDKNLQIFESDSLQNLPK